MAFHHEALHPSLETSESIVELRARGLLAGRSPLRQLWAERSTGLEFEDWLHAATVRWRLASRGAASSSLLRFLIEEPS